MPKYYNADEVDAVLEKLEDDYGGTSFIAGIYTAHNCIRKVPTADVAPVVHAHWERLDFPKRKRDYYRCTNCGRVRSRDYDDEQPISEMLPFCNCGAKMDEEVKQ